MYIASALRRKRDEIAATIAAYEARIDAARMDLPCSNRPRSCSKPNATRRLPLANSEGMERHNGRRQPNAKSWSRSGRLFWSIGACRRQGKIL
jgi:hypothetical protein